MRTADTDATDGAEEVDKLIEEADKGPGECIGAAVLAAEESSFVCPMARRTMRTEEGTCTAWGRLCNGALRPPTRPSGDLRRRPELQALLQALFAPGEDNVFQGALGDRCRTVVPVAVTEGRRPKEVATAAVDATDAGGTVTAVSGEDGPAEAAEKSAVAGSTAAAVPAAAATEATGLGLICVCRCARGPGEREAVAITETLRGDVQSQTEDPPVPLITAEPPLVTGLDVDATKAHGGEHGAEHGDARDERAIGLDTIKAGVSEHVAVSVGGTCP